MKHQRCTVSRPEPDDFTDDVARRLMALWAILVRAPPPPGHDGQATDEKLPNQVGHLRRNQPARRH